MGSSHEDICSRAVESHLYYQIAGRHPDLNRNGIDDFIDIAGGRSKDANGDGVPDEVQHCLPPLRALDVDELKLRNLRLSLAEVERQESSLDCEKRCRPNLDEETCEKECSARFSTLEKAERELRESLESQVKRLRHEKERISALPAIQVGRQLSLSEGLRNPRRRASLGRRRATGAWAKAT